MKKIVLSITAVIIISWQVSSFATSSVDTLIQKLEDKGILTYGEAAQIKGEIAHEEQSSQQTTFKTLLPDWLNSIKLTGDLRLRDQYQRIKVPGTTHTLGSNAGYNRVRVRARLDFQDQVNDKLKVIFGISTNGENSSGVGNPRSNNLTFGGNSNPSENSFNKPQVSVNKAYAIYTPASYLTLEGGKLDNPIWEPAPLLWDPNITPEGGVIQVQKKLNDYITPFSTNALFIIADGTPSSATTSFKTDPYLFLSQNGIKGNLTKNYYYKTAFSYYGVSNPNHDVFGNRPSTSSNPVNNTNTTNAAGTNYLYSYYLVGGSAELGVNNPFASFLPVSLRIPQAGVFGQYFQNQDPKHNNAAWQIGGYAGASKVNGWGTWKLQSYYRVIERDAWLDIFPDTNFYNGATDTKGWVSEFDLGLAKNTYFALTYYKVDVYKRFATLSQGSTAYSKSGPEDLIQADFNFKF